MKMSKDEKRKFKYSTKPLSKFSVVSPFFYMLLQYPTAKQSWNFLWVLLKDFFFLQNWQRLHITKRPVIYVDTKLDEKVPFVPEKVNTYIGFIPFFIRPITMLIKRLGYKKAAWHALLFVRFIGKNYSNAASVYRFCMTTTHRPKYYKTHAFRTIHFFDPHLLCVPSLHVAIAAGTYQWFKQAFSLGILPEDEAQARLAEIKKEAIAIIESVLFVKQHSVNCIPLALYMLSSTMGKSFLPANEALDIMTEVFSSAEEITPEVRKEISEYFKFMYEKALLENYYSYNWQDSIKHWIVEYAKKTGQKI